MGPVAILCPALSRADAVGHDVLGMERALRSWGWEVCVFAKAWDVDHPGIRRFARIFSYLSRPGATLIYHHSVGWREGLQIVSESACRKVIKYHNVTPADYFYGHHCDYYYASWLGRSEIGPLARGNCDLYLADSGYNLGEFVQAGAPESACAVLPPFHVADRLVDSEINLRLLDEYADGKSNILTVGRLVPNKNHRALIDAFALYHFAYNRDSRLIIVGKEDSRLRSYARAVRDHVHTRGLDEAIIFAGGVSNEDLRTYYELATVFAMTSAHEGFSVPLVEAMALGVPIAAFGTSAVPETIGDAGVICASSEAGFLADAIHSLVGDEGLRQEYSARGRLRYRQYFLNQQIASRLRTALEHLYEPSATTAA
jgi:glycosyltransferase involved in cell wall biosynthesis